MAMSAAASLADISRFYDSLNLIKLSRAALELGFPKRILAIELQIHTTARMIRQECSYSKAVVARSSCLAGTRHVNNLARAVVYGVMGELYPGATPAPHFPQEAHAFQDLRMVLLLFEKRGVPLAK